MVYYGYGVMGAAKTLNALKIVFDYETKGSKVILLSDSVLVKSRVGLEHKAFQYQNLTPDEFDEIYTETRPSAIIIDEVQFCPPDLLRHIVTKYGEGHLYCYGLYHTSSQGVFKNSEYLMAQADITQEFYSVCQYCDNLATRHAVVIRDCDGYNKVVYDTTDTKREKAAYVSLCDKCFDAMHKIVL